MAASMLLGGVSLIAIHQLTRVLHTTAETTARQAEVAASLQADFQKMRAASHASQISITIGLMDKGSQREGQCAGCHDATMIQQKRTAFHAASQEVLSHLTQLSSLESSPGQLQNVKALRRGVEEWIAADDSYHRQAAGGAFDSAHSLVADRIFPLVEQSGATAAVLQSEARQVLQSSIQAADARARLTYIVVIAIGVLTFLVGAIAVIVLRRASRTLSNVAAELDHSAQTVVHAGANVSQTSQTLAQSAAGQEQAFQQTAAESREVTALAQSNSRDATLADEAVSRAASRTAEARQCLHQMLGAMQGVHQSSEQIAKIIKIIDGIAFQTNILALNAAVEAARAGESGMGFAVVADEVRSLAHRCAEAARETSGLIEELHRSASEGRTRVEDAVAAVDAIAGDTEQVRSLVAQVHAGSVNQAQGMERLGRSLSAIENATAQTARSADESASESEELNQTSTTLADAVGQLSRLVGV